MSEQINQKTVFTLYEVSQSIQKTIAERYKSAYWIKAEMNKLNFYSHSGHCYPELVEKVNGKTVAQMKASLWKDDYLSINRNFLRTLKEPLKDGIKILFLAKISFDPAYGLSLRIIDIDPSFTLGDLEKEKQDTINCLQEENIFNNNKYRKLPLLPKRIAIISVETSKGYADFLKVIEGNPWSYRFFTMLFPSLLQGEKVPAAMIAQLKKIESVKEHFDVVAIIRGGGGDVGLSCYNNYELAKAIALFPIPVITGIGHATNETVCEMVSFANAITPTKLAEMLLQKFHNFSVPVQQAQEKITDRSRRLLTEERTKFGSMVKLLRSVTGNISLVNRNAVREKNQSLIHLSAMLLERRNEQLRKLREQLSTGTLLFTKTCGFDLKNAEKNLSNMDPKNVLRRGFSISYVHGKAVTNAAQVKVGDEMRTVFFEGEINSTIEEK